MIVEFVDWIKTPSADECKSRLEAGEKGNEHNPWLAAGLAYEGGIKEGKRQAAEILEKLITGK